MPLRRRTFQVTRGGVRIEEYPVKDAVNSGIRYAPAFEEWEAGTAAGLDMWAWDGGQYPARFKAKTIAWWRAHRLVNTHQADAQNRASEAKSKRKR